MWGYSELCRCHLITNLHSLRIRMCVCHFKYWFPSIRPAYVALRGNYDYIRPLQMSCQHSHFEACRYTSMHDENLSRQVDDVSLSTVVVTFRFQVLRFQVGEHLLSKVLPSPHETFLAGGMEHLEPFFRLHSGTKSWTLELCDDEANGGRFSCGFLRMR